MKVAVIGRETTVGRTLCDVLGAAGPAVEVVEVATEPGAGHRAWVEALGGAEAVVDVADAAVPHDHDVRESVLAATRRAVVAAERSGASHFVLVSSAGLGRPAEELHFRARLGAERLVEASRLPHTIVRTTQLFESVERLVVQGLHAERTRARVVVQPIAARDVAAAVAEIVHRPPRRGVVALAGPETFHLDELVERLRLARSLHRERWATPAQGSGSPAPLPGGTATLTSTRLHDWLSTATVGR